MPTELLPQLPPSVPPLLLRGDELNSKDRFRSMIGCGAITLIGIILVAALFGPSLPKDPKRSNMITANMNAKQIGLALFEFEAKYGKFPDASTASKVKADSGSTWIFNDGTSNDLFQQLFVAGICQSEEIFYAKTPWSKKPDNIRSSETTLLATKECAFAFMVGLSSKDDPETPVCVTPLEPGKLTFDRELFGGKAVMLRVDRSAICVTIDATGHAILNGMDLFDPRQPFWHGKAPTVKWPK